MYEYESKNVEELRVEDYASNQKGPQPGNVRPSDFFATTPWIANLFGAPISQPQSSGLLGTQSTRFGAKPPNIFGQGSTAFNQEPLFGTNSFGTPTTAAIASGLAGFGKLLDISLNFIATALNVTNLNLIQLIIIGTSTGSTATTTFGAAEPFDQLTAGLFCVTAGTTNRFGQRMTSGGAVRFGATPAINQPVFGGLTSSATNTAAGMKPHFLLVSSFI